MEFLYTKHDLTTTNKYEDVNIDDMKYYETFRKLLLKAICSALDNGNEKEELLFYMEKYYYSYENREQDNKPIDLLYEEWDPDREWLEL